jgi:methylmalonyl-CoA/ethylmalonyl-CoA epimerase
MGNVDMKFHHLGIAVYDFMGVISFFENQGYTKILEIFDPEQNVEVCILKHDISPCIELLAPHDEKSPINNILKKIGATPYHICYEVDDIEESIIYLKREKFLPVSKPKVSNAFDNRRVCFLIKKDIGLIEIIEKQ